MQLPQRNYTKVKQTAALKWTLKIFDCTVLFKNVYPFKETACKNYKIIKTYREQTCGTNANLRKNIKQGVLKAYINETVSHLVQQSFSMATYLTWQPVCQCHCDIPEGIVSRH